MRLLLSVSIKIPEALVITFSPFAINTRFLRITFFSSFTWNLYFSTCAWLSKGKRNNDDIKYFFFITSIRYRYCYCFCDGHFIPIFYHIFYINDNISFRSFCKWYFDLEISLFIGRNRFAELLKLDQCLIDRCSAVCRNQSTDQRFFFLLL